MYGYELTWLEHHISCVIHQNLLVSQKEVLGMFQRTKFGDRDLTCGKVSQGKLYSWIQLLRNPGR